MKVWNADIKQEARLKTIIEPVKNRFFKEFGGKIPEGRQYWTNPGNMLDEHGNKNLNNEFEQLHREGVFTQNQFYGVEIHRPTLEKNKILYPELKLFHGDLYDVIKNHYENGNFHPAVINLDLYHMAKYGAMLFSSILDVASKIDIGQIFIVLNITLKNLHNGFENTENDLPTFVSEDPRWILHGQKWQWAPYCMHYDGSTDKTNKMCSYLFFKP